MQDVPWLEWVRGSMKVRQSMVVQYVTACTAVCLAVAAGVASFPRAAQQATVRLFDGFADVAGPGVASGQVALVEVDEASLAQFGRWPWPRARVAQLIHTLAAAGAAAVALDFVFPEPDGQESDAPLTAALAEVPVTLGHWFRFDGKPALAGGCVVGGQAPASGGASKVQSSGGVPEAMSVVCSAPAIERAAAAHGFLNVTLDPDGVVRRAPLGIRFRDQMDFGLGIAALQLYQAKASQSAAVVRAPAGDWMLRFRDAEPGLPRSGLPHYSAGRLMRDATAEPDLRGKLVVVGTFAGGLAAPLSSGGRVLGTAVVHATVADNLLAGDFFQVAESGGLAAGALMLLVWLITPQLYARYRIFTASAACVGIAVLLWAGSLALLLQGGVFVTPLYATLAIAGSSSACAALKLRWVRQRNQASLHQVASAKHFILNALALLTTMRDPETGDHLQRIERYMRVLCRALSHDPKYTGVMSEETIRLMVQLAPIHDVGKVGVPDHILRKAGSLTAEELLVIRQHVVFGRDVLQKASDRSGLNDETFFRTAYELVYSHHERWDGRGYPQGLSGEGIPLAARLMAVADVYDALVSKRVYKEAFSHQEAVRIITAESARHFDPDVVQAFLRAEAEFRRIRAESAEGTSPRGYPASAAGAA